MIKPKFTALKVNGNRIKILNEERFREYVSTLPEQLELTLFPLTRGRSNEQNRYMWGVVYKILADELGYSCEEVHEIMAAKFLKHFVTITTKEGIEEVEIVRSTTSLKTTEMEEYLEKIRQWSAMELGISIPLPNEVDNDTKR